MEKPKKPYLPSALSPPLTTPEDHNHFERSSLCSSISSLFFNQSSHRRRPRFSSVVATPLFRSVFAAVSPCFCRCSDAVPPLLIPLFSHLRRVIKLQLPLPPLSIFQNA
ncbi:hypothetical protein AAHE18_06G012800 [Arachis hypogaea]